MEISTKYINDNIIKIEDNYKYKPIKIEKIDFPKRFYEFILKEYNKPKYSCKYYECYGLCFNTDFKINNPHKLITPLSMDKTAILYGLILDTISAEYIDFKYVNHYINVLKGENVKDAINFACRILDRYRYFERSDTEIYLYFENKNHIIVFNKYSNNIFTNIKNDEKEPYSDYYLSGRHYLVFINNEEKYERFMNYDDIVKLYEI